MFEKRQIERKPRKVKNTVLFAQSYSSIFREPESYNLMTLYLYSTIYACFTHPFSIRTAVFVVLLRHGGYFGKKETPFAAAMSPAEAFIGRIAFHLQVKTIFNFSAVRHYSQKKACMVYNKSTVKSVVELSGTKVAGGKVEQFPLFNENCSGNK